MKKNILYIILLGVIGMFIQSCQSDPAFPDPGFELADQRVEVRRDNADYYDIKIDMNVPNGVKEIVILNATDYSLIETVDDYNGKTNFQFLYRVDLTSIVEETVLNYIIKVTDNDGRSFNRGIRILVKPFSAPDIKLSGGTNVAVAAPAYYVQGLVTAGLHTIASIQIEYNGNVTYTYTPLPGQELHDFNLRELVLLGDLDENSRPITITITDNTNLTKTVTINVRKTTEFKKPTRINYRYTTGTGATILIYIYPTYDSEGKITAFDYVWTSPAQTYRTEFQYNEDTNMVTEIRYRNINSSGLTTSESYTYITYIPDTKKIDKIEKLTNAYSNGEISSPGTRAIETSTWTYDATTGKALSFKTSANVLVNNLYYLNPYNPDEHVFAEYWQDDSFTNVTNSLKRQHRESFYPILMPTYMSGLPLFFRASGVPQIVYNDLFQSKYLPEKTVYTASQPTTPTSGPLVPTYNYETDEDGFVTQITKTNTTNLGVKTIFTYNFFYD